MRLAIEMAEKAHDGKSRIRMVPRFVRIEISDKPYPERIKFVLTEEGDKDEAN